MVKAANQVPVIDEASAI